MEAPAPEFAFSDTRLSSHHVRNVGELKTKLLATIVNSHPRKRPKIIHSDQQRWRSAQIPEIENLEIGDRQKRCPKPQAAHAYFSDRKNPTLQLTSGYSGDENFAQFAVRPAIRQQ